ncbi:hypothetical protein [Ferruginivarius sediminum]|uniref:Uncharacterized protein n=1 Tax=Ferruginivarius sediminum TaxID=2661937 RepID=A0A369TDQ7_9PROT|nr:hypothetical protein [Ferruginivarius sediminum]RDD63491.1 hypothetical protein DRB17_03345 [Ferruginivarius sediminum]
MTDLPPCGLFETAGGDIAMHLEEAGMRLAGIGSRLEDALAATRGLPGGAAESPLVIAGGRVTPSAAVHAIDTQDRAGVDEVANIVQANHPDGRLLLIRVASAERTVVVRHQAGGAGEVRLADGRDLTLDAPGKWLLLKRSGTQWEEILRTHGLDRAAARAFDGFVDPVLDRADAGALDGVDALNGGPLAGMRNRLINGDFRINQRGFGGGWLAAGAYGYDRWAAGPDGADVTAGPGGLVTLRGGSVVQPMEAPELAGQTVTVSVEEPSADLDVSVAGMTRRVVAGYGRRGASFELPRTVTETVHVELAVAGEPATFRRVQLEPGRVATPFEHRFRATEEALCQRYYFLRAGDTALYAGMTAETADARVFIPTPVTLRSVPAIRPLEPPLRIEAVGNGAVDSSASALARLSLETGGIAGMFRARRVGGFQCLTVRLLGGGSGMIEFDAEIPV